MKIIPVIDYKQGNVVLAKMGMREQYEPASSLLCKSSNIYDVIDAILNLADFKTIYIADLDCIEKQQLDADLWIALGQHYQNLEFWIDIGSMYKQWPMFMNHTSNARPVLGSESFLTNSDLDSGIKLLMPYKPIISIDIIESEILGPKNLLRSTKLWPSDVIILSISHVGSNQGPDKQAISHIQSITQNKNLYYGGGIRDKNDIDQLSGLNIAGALVASTLHSGKLSEQEIAEVTS